MYPWSSSESRRSLSPAYILIYTSSSSDRVSMLRYPSVRGRDINLPRPISRLLFRRSRRSRAGRISPESKFDGISRTTSPRESSAQFGCARLHAYEKTILPLPALSLTKDVSKVSAILSTTGSRERGASYRLSPTRDAFSIRRVPEIVDSISRVFLVRVVRRASPPPLRGKIENISIRSQSRVA